MKKNYIFMICLIGSIANAHDTFFSASYSWLENHKLMIAGLALMGAGIATHKIIYAREKFREPVEFSKTEAEISQILTEKYPSYQEYKKKWKNGGSVLKLDFANPHYLTKSYSDIYTLTAPTPIKCEESSSAEGKTTITIRYAPLDTSDKTVNVKLESRLRSIRYADWVRNVCVGIGAAATLKSVIFD